MAGTETVVAKQMRQKSPLCRCYGHGLTLALSTSDAVKECHVMSDTLATSFEI